MTAECKVVWQAQFVISLCDRTLSGRHLPRRTPSLPRILRGRPSSCSRNLDRGLTRLQIVTIMAIVGNRWRIVMRFPQESLSPAQLEIMEIVWDKSEVAAVEVRQLLA